MKKFYIMLLLLCIFAASCSTGPVAEESSLSSSDSSVKEESDEAQSTDKDVQNKFNFLASEMCETSDAVYGLSEKNFVVFFDKASKTSGILCGRPECMHDDSSCNASVDALAQGLTVYANKLYWIGQEHYQNKVSELYLWCMNLDGTNLQKLKKLDKELWSVVKGNTFVEIHRENIYVAGIIGVVNQGQPSETVMVYAESVEDETAEPVIVFEKKFSNEPTPNVRIMPIGDQVYIMLSYSNGDGTCGLELYVWNSKTSELTTLYEEKRESFYAWEMWVEEGDGIYMSSFSIESIGADVPAGAYKYDFAANEISQCFEIRDGEKFYTIANIGDDIVFITGRDEDNNRKLFVMNFDGVIIYNEKLDIPELMDGKVYGAIPYGGDNESIYMLFSGSDDYIMQAYMIQIPLSEDAEPIIMWKEERKIN